MPRSSAHVLVLVMLLSSGRLLACGLECLGEMVATAEASCHQEPVSATAMTGGSLHACLPEVAEPSVRLAKPTVLAWVAMPVATVTESPWGQQPATRGLRWLHHQLASPHQARLAVLRI